MPPHSTVSYILCEHLPGLADFGVLQQNHTSNVTTRLNPLL